MTRYVHIVQVHPVENGLPNLHKVILEKEFTTRQQADEFILFYNTPAAEDGDLYAKAVYLGRVNDATGELE